MKALVYEGVRTVSLREVDVPEPKAGEHLIRVEAVGICGSDMHAYLGHDERRPAPLILGHEAAGTVVGGAWDGKRVTVNPLVTCGNCDACRSGQDNLCVTRQIISMPPREGAFAQYVTMPERNLVEIPNQIDVRKAALVEPVACGWHATKVAERSVTISGSTALVFGGGAIGLGAALSLVARGAASVRIVEPSEQRRMFLRERTGLDVIHPDELGGKELFDLVVDGVGYSGTREAASLHARPGGVIVHIGLGESFGGLDIRRLTLQEITFVGTYTYTAHDFRETAEALFSGALGPIDWISTRSLSEGAAAFAELLEGRCEAPKIVLEPWMD